MFNRVSFCVGNKTIEVNGGTFDLGELTADCLNISPTEYDRIRDLNEKGKKLCRRYARTKSLSDWFSANECFIAIDELLCSHKIFASLRDYDDSVLSETREFTQQYSLLDETDTSPLIFPGSTAEKWKFYLDYVEGYDQIINDLYSFNNTIFHFVQRCLMNLDELNPNSYASALSSFLYDERSYKWVANPVESSGLFTSVDEMKVRHIPRETFPGSGEYKIYDYYDASTLQGFLKTDFYGALSSGFIIRQCEYCGRYFLLKNARHTKYCDRRFLESNATCATLGYRMRGVKEAAGDDPRAASLRRLLMRLDKDLAKKAITYAEMERVIAKAKDLYHDATIGSKVSFEDFEKQLKSENIYPLCGIERRSKPRGRPKKVTPDE